MKRYYNILKQFYVKFTDEINIILSYGTILISAYFIQWKSFGILMSYLIETFIILLIYLGTGYFRTYKNNVIKPPNLGKILYGVIPFFVIHFFIIAVTSATIDHSELKSWKVLFSPESLFCFLSLSIFYIGQMRGIKSNYEKQKLFQDNFLYKVIVLSCVGFVGLIVIQINQEISLFGLLCFTVPVRVLFEFFFRKKIQIIRR